MNTLATGYGSRLFAYLGSRLGLVTRLGGHSRWGTSPGGLVISTPWGHS